MNIGFISQKYESGFSGPGTISSGKGDPGGKSYGTHQLAIRTGSLQDYVKTTKFTTLKKYILGSSLFDREWKRLAKHDPVEFGNDQHRYIKRTHYDPVRKEADSLGLPSTEAINEALFSIGVQHGRAKHVVYKAVILLDSVQDKDEDEIVRALYQARRDYVSKLRLRKALKKVLLNRYDSEERDVLRLCQ